VKRRDFFKEIGGRPYCGRECSKRRIRRSSACWRRFHYLLLPEIWTPLGSGLQDIGYFEGRNYTLEFWFADGMVERLPEVPQRRSVSLFHPRFLQKLMK